MTDAHAQLDVLGFETDLYDTAMTRASDATTVSEKLSHLLDAISHGFAILEHITPLRAVDAGGANQLAESWREIVQDLIAQHDRALRDRLAELDS